jgi:hypothetical protein
MTEKYNNSEAEAFQAAVQLTGIGANHLLIACAFIASDSDPDAPVVSDTFGLSWTVIQVTATRNGTRNGTFYVWWALSGSNTGSDTFSLTGTGTPGVESRLAFHDYGLEQLLLTLSSRVETTDELRDAEYEREESERETKLLIAAAALCQAVQAAAGYEVLVETE